MEFIKFEELGDGKFIIDGKTGNFSELRSYEALFDELSSKIDELNVYSSNNDISDVKFRVRALFEILGKCSINLDIKNINNKDEVLLSLKSFVFSVIIDLNVIISTAENKIADQVNGKSLELFLLLYDRLYDFTFDFIGRGFILNQQPEIIIQIMVDGVISRDRVKEYKKVNYILSKDLEEAKEELVRYDGSEKNMPAVELYKEINEDFQQLENKYRKYFLISIVLTLFLAVAYDPVQGIGGNIHSLTCSINKSLIDGCSEIISSKLFPFNSDSLKYILYKFAVLVVGITLTTYFLRLSSFYQLKQEQAKQTKLELEAFPDYVSGLDKTIANSLRQELALKYFGKEIDKTLIDKNGDLIQEQLKAGTELIKASTDVVKTVKPSGASESS
ncbi:hypothetical protein [Acinetobacter junii]|uniref:hypothetical protein n=1 Tax=Acinetobacter junii TaxID=40215 RepID=UPI00321377DD